MANPNLRILYRKKGYQKKMIDYYTLKHNMAKKPGFKAMFKEKAQYHMRKFKDLDRMIKMIERGRK